MKRSTFHQMEAIISLVELIQKSPDFGNDTSTQILINKLSGNAEQLRDRIAKDQPVKQRVLVLPSDPKDKGLFAVEALAEAFGLRIALAVVDAEEVQIAVEEPPAVLQPNGKWTDTPPVEPTKTDEEPVTTVEQGVRISKKTGQPIRGYVKGGRPGTHYNKHGRAKVRLS